MKQTIEIPWSKIRWQEAHLRELSASAEKIYHALDYAQKVLENPESIDAAIKMVGDAASDVWELKQDLDLAFIEPEGEE